MTKAKIFTNGLIKENPAFRLVLGTCPTLAVTVSIINGLGMGVATLFVLVCSNIVVSLLRNVIPAKVRLPAFITIIATFVTICGMLMNAYLPDLALALGEFLALIVVNCIILGRAEMFASKNNVVRSAIDGFGMGLGFTLALVSMGAVRELFGEGSLFGIYLIGEKSIFGAESFAAAVEPMRIFTMPAGGFFVFGVLMALVVYIENKTNNTIKRSVGCEACPTKGVCAMREEAAE